MKTCLLTIFLFYYALHGSAQHEVDTTSQLDSVMVLAKAVKPLGQPSTIKREDWLSGKLASNPSEALQYLPGVYIRQQGPGQIVTLQYRGLQGARIAQTWQGIPVTNPQLGTGDANEIRLALLDQVTIGSPMAIGNAAAVSVTQSKSEVVSATARYAEGKGYLVSGQWKGLRVLFQDDQHQFNHTLNSFSGQNYRTSRPETNTRSLGASYSSDFARRWKMSSYFLESTRSTSFIYDGFEAFSSIQNLKTRTARQLFTYSKDTTEKLDLGILYDEQLYQSTSTAIVSDGTTFQPFFQYQVQLFRGAKIITDNRILFSNHVRYVKRVVRPETRTLLNYSISPKAFSLEGSAGIHARLNSGNIVFGNISFTKSISRKEFFQINVRRIGRIPNLDDQLWDQGGDENLLPELGWDLTTSSQGMLGPILITPIVFARRYSNYILWLPRGSFWTPFNVPDVDNLGVGLDISGEVGSKTQRVNFLGSLGYSQLRLVKDYELPNRVVLLSRENLPFSPELVGNISIDYHYKRWSWLLQGRYTSEQQTSYNSLSQYDDFTVLRSSLSFQSSIGIASISCDNLTNKTIPNDFGLFSPLRRFELSLSYTPK